MTRDSKSRIRGQKWVTFANILEELCEWGWIEKKQSEDAENVKVYSLLERGKKIAILLTDLEKSHQELWKLDSFFEVTRVS